MKKTFTTFLPLACRCATAWLVIIFTLSASLAISQSAIPVTYSTEPVPAGKILRDANAVVYVLGVSAPTNFVRLKGLSITTTGTYTDADVSEFTLSSINSDGSGYYEWGTSTAAPTGHGETLTWNFGGEGDQFPQVIPNMKTLFTIKAKKKLSQSRQNRRY